MPGIPLLYDPNHKTINELADTERKERIAHNQAGWQYYNGDHHKPLKVRPGDTDDNIIVNMIGSAIDKTTEAMGIPELSIEGGIDNVVDETGTVSMETSIEQETLEALIDASDFEMLLPDTLTNGAVEGHIFWRIVVDPNEDGTGEVSVDNLPYLMPIDANYMTVFWYQLNRKKVLYYRMEWQFEKDVYRQDIVPGWLLQNAEINLTVKQDEWAILQYKQENGRGKFELESGDIWHYPFAPIIEWKNRRNPKQYYGETDLKNAGLNDSLNFVMSNTARIIKWHAHPKTIGTGMDASDVVETMIDGFFTVEDSNASVSNLEMQSDLQSSMAFIELLRNNFFSLQRVVDVSGIKDRLGQISNFGVRMLFDDMIKMLEDKQSRYGEAINEAFKRMLFMTGIEVEGVMVKWTDPLPVDMRELIDIAEKEKNLGITSDQTIAKELKRDYVKEQAQRKEEQDIAADDRVNTIVRLAQTGLNG